MQRRQFLSAFQVQTVNVTLITGTSYAFPANLVPGSVFVEARAAGGPGAGSALFSVNGGGGGAGEARSGFDTSISSGQTVSYTLGTKGTGVTNNPGNPSSDLNWNSSTIICKCGVRGQYTGPSSPGGAGGTGGSGGTASQAGGNGAAANGSDGGNGGSAVAFGSIPAATGGLAVNNAAGGNGADYGAGGGGGDGGGNFPGGNAGAPIIKLTYKVYV